jgi:hypothetical protein
MRRKKGTIDFRPATPPKPGEVLPEPPALRPINRDVHAEWQAFNHQLSRKAGNSLYAYEAFADARMAGRRPEKWCDEFVTRKLANLVTLMMSGGSVKRDDILKALDLMPKRFREYRLDLRALTEEAEEKRTRERDRARSRKLLGGSAKAERKRRPKKPD